MTSCSDTLAQSVASCGQEASRAAQQVLQTVTGRPICIAGHAITQTVSRRPHTAKTKVSIPGHFVWDLYWIFWHWDNFSPGTQSFPPSLSFNQCSISTNLTTINVAQTYKRSASSNYTFLKKREKRFSHVSVGCSQFRDVDVLTISQPQKGLAVSRHVLVAECTV